MEDQQCTPRAICPGVKVRLREDTLKYVEIREWEFQKVEKGLIFLRDTKNGHTLRINLDDIEWRCDKGDGEIVSA